MDTQQTQTVQGALTVDADEHFHRPDLQIQHSPWTLLYPQPAASLSALR